MANEFEQFSAARASGDDAAAAAAVAEEAEQTPIEQPEDEHGANPIERKLRERFQEEHKSIIEEDKPEGEEKPPEEKLEEKPEERPERRHRDPKRRISELTKERYEARTEAEQARAEAAEWKARAEALEKQGKPLDRESTPQEVKAASREERISKLRQIEPKYDEVIKTIDGVPQVAREMAQQVDNSLEVEFVLAGLSPEEREDLARRTPETQRAIVRELSEELSKIHRGESDAPEVAKAARIQQVAEQLDNVSDLQFLLEKDPGLGAHLMALPTHKAIAAVKDIAANLKAKNFPTIRAVAEAIQDEGEAGQRVYAHFEQHPQEFEKIATLPPVKAAREVTRLAASLEAPRAKSVSRVPPPIKPVGNSSRSTPELAENMSLEDFSRLRKQGYGR